jgi:hypothetical protein
MNKSKKSKKAAPVKFSPAGIFVFVFSVLVALYYLMLVVGFDNYTSGYTVDYLMTQSFLGAAYILLVSYASV